MKKTRVLLKDIAREANCSTAAVSRALSADVQQQKLVAPDTFAAIMQAANSGDVADQCRLCREILEKNFDVIQAVQTRKDALLGYSNT